MTGMSRDQLPGPANPPNSSRQGATRPKSSPARAKLPELLTIGELAEHLGVGERHIRRLIAERRVPYLKWGHLIRFDPDEIAAWLDQNRRRASPAS
jgi:excisionase family DNA binding protein